MDDQRHALSHWSEIEPGPQLMWLAVNQLNHGTALKSEKKIELQLLVYPALPGLRHSIAFGKVPRLRSFVILVRTTRR